MEGAETDRQTGSVVISIDAELGWGFHDFDSPPEARLERSRDGWKALATLLDEYRVPATWAIVGHLLLDACDSRHADHPAGEQWFEWEREGQRDLRFGDGLVDRVRDAPTDHEISCHTFSHVEFGDPDTSRDVAVGELEYCQEIFGECGIDFSTFVFPRNMIGHRDVLAEFDLDAYRGGRPPKGSIFDQAVAPLRGNYEPNFSEPTIDEYGLVNVPPSQYLYCFEGIYHQIAARTVGDPMVAQARQGIDAAAESGSIFHMWLHPNNLTGGLQRRRFEQILEYIDQRRDDIRIETIADVAARVKANRSPVPTI